MAGAFFLLAHGNVRLLIALSCAVLPLM